MQKTGRQDTVIKCPFDKQDGKYPAGTMPKKNFTLMNIIRDNEKKNA
jgi:hypothetical protein